MNIGVAARSGPYAGRAQDGTMDGKWTRRARDDACSALTKSPVSAAALKTLTGGGMVRSPPVGTRISSQGFSSTIGRASRCDAIAECRRRTPIRYRVRERQAVVQDSARAGSDRAPTRQRIQGFWKQPGPGFPPDDARFNSAGGRCAHRLPLNGTRAYAALTGKWQGKRPRRRQRWLGAIVMRPEPCTPVSRVPQSLTRGKGSDDHRGELAASN